MVTQGWGGGRGAQAGRQGRDGEPLNLQDLLLSAPPRPSSSLSSLFLSGWGLSPHHPSRVSNLQEYFPNSAPDPRLPTRPSR